MTINREEIRARWDAATRIIDYQDVKDWKPAEKSEVSESVYDIPALLYELDEKDKEIERLRNDLAKRECQVEAAVLMIEPLENENERLEARAEALKRAMNEGQCCIACTARPGCGQILPCERYVFDETRFSKED